MDGPVKLMIYPYNPISEVLLKNRDLFDDYRIEVVASYKEDEAALAYCASKYEVKADSFDTKMFQSVDAVLLVDMVVERTTEGYYSVATQALECGKKVLCTENTKNFLNGIDPILSEKITLLNNVHTLSQSYFQEGLLNIKTPIIAIAGEGEDCGKFESQLQLLRCLHNDGYRFGIINSNSYGALLGSTSWPRQLFSDTLCFEEKVLIANHYVFDFCKQNDFDAVILGVPGGLSVLGTKCTNHFSEVPLVISNAVNIDAAHINLYFDMNMEEQFIEQYKTYCYYKYNLPVASVGVSRQRVVNDMESHRFLFYHLDESFFSKDYVKKYCKENGLINPNDLDAGSMIYKRIIRALENNPQIV